MLMVNDPRHNDLTLITSVSQQFGQLGTKHRLCPGSSLIFGRLVANEASEEVDKLSVVPFPHLFSKQNGLIDT